MIADTLFNFSLIAAPDTFDNPEMTITHLFGSVKPAPEFVEEDMQLLAQSPSVVDELHIVTFAYQKVVEIITNLHNPFAVSFSGAGGHQPGHLLKLGYLPVGETVKAGCYRISFKNSAGYIGVDNFLGGELGDEIADLRAIFNDAIGHQLLERFTDGGT